MSGTNSNSNSDADSDEALVTQDNNTNNIRTRLSRHKGTAVAILCFVNLINYMDRFTIAGVLTDIKDHFNLSDGQTGFLQTAFILSYMVFAPLFGYLGDRYSRTIIMIVGISIWSLTTFCGSLVDNFGWFVFFRAMVGLGEASYSTIAPTVISDLYVKDGRSKMLSLFYFAIPVGSGLGYIVGSETATLMNNWKWALKVTPFLGTIAVALMLLFLKDPERGEAEGGSHIAVNSYKQDLKELARNRSFILSTAGFTCVTFVAGALSWWGPHYIHLGIQVQTDSASTTLNDVSFIFGVITMLSGIIGVPLGTYLGKVLVKKYPKAHPVICGAGLVISAPFIVAAIFLIETQTTLPFILIFFGELTLNLNWAIVADMLLYVVIPTRRSTAEAFQILISHTFGDAGSPYLIGIISEALKLKFLPAGSHHRILPPNSTLPVATMSENLAQFKSLQYAMYITSFVEVLGGVFFFLTAIYIVKDKLKVEREISDNRTIQPSNIDAEDVNVESEIMS